LIGFSDPISSTTMVLISLASCYNLKGCLVNSVIFKMSQSTTSLCDAVSLPRWGIKSSIFSTSSPNYSTSGSYFSIPMSGKKSLLNFNIYQSQQS
jgi:hypothetical protein